MFQAKKRLVVSAAPARRASADSGHSFSHRTSTVLRQQRIYPEPQHAQKPRETSPIYPAIPADSCGYAGYHQPPSHGSATARAVWRAGLDTTLRPALPFPSPAQPGGPACAPRGSEPLGTAGSQGAGWNPRSLQGCRRPPRLPPQASGTPGRAVGIGEDPVSLRSADRCPRWAPDDPAHWRSLLSPQEEAPGSWANSGRLFAPQRLKNRYFS